MIGGFFRIIHKVCGNTKVRRLDEKMVLSGLSQCTENSYTSKGHSNLVYVYKLSNAHREGVAMS